MESEFSSVIECLTSTLRTTNYDLAQNVISSEHPISLQSLALTKVTVSLWQQEYFGAKIVHFLALDYDFDNTYLPDIIYRGWWYPIKEEILDKVPLLELPKLCREALEERIDLVGEQLLKFLASQNYLVVSLTDEIKKSESIDNLWKEKFIKFCFDYICWTHQGTINYLRSAESLIENADLSTRDKFIIACNNCLEEKIRHLYDQLPHDFINCIIKEERCYLVLYWMYHTQGEQRFFLDIMKKDGYEGTNVNCYMFKWAVRNMNEVAVQYFWKNFNDEEMTNSIVSCGKVCLKVRHSKYLDVFCYLILKMNEIQIEELLSMPRLNLYRKSFRIRFKGIAYELIRKFLDNWRWHDVFLLTATRIIKLIKTLDVEDVLFIFFCWKKTVFDLDKYKIQLIEIVNYFEGDIRANFHSSLATHFYPLMSQDIEVIKLFLSKGTAQDKLKFMYAHDAYNGFGFFCEDLLNSRRLSIIEIIIKEMLGTEKKMEDFKVYFLNERSMDICHHMVFYEKYDEVDDFIGFFLGSERCSSFKCSLPHRENKRIINVLVEAKGDEAAVQIDQFLNWAFDFDKDKVSEFKANFLFEYE